MSITPRPQVKTAEDFINGAPDAGRAPAPVAPPAAPAAAPTAAPAAPAALVPKGGRKKLISLTMDPNILAALDAKATALGLSRAGAFALAVSRFIAAEDREANR